MNSLVRTVLILSLGFIMLDGANAKDFANYKWKRIQDLSGLWKFEIGDNPAWADTDYDDSRWETIFVPSSWEDEGFPGYDGFAWYRLNFTISSRHKDEQLALFMGYIDDADQVFINGKLVNFEGGMPSYRYVETAYHINRIYAIPPKYLNFDGDNVIAVRVYDNYHAGGIVSGRIGIYSVQSPIDLNINLSGYWKFRTGDLEQWKEPNYNDNNWDEIIVPAIWESQGFWDYNGLAWYRKTFVLPGSFEGSKVILLLGKIDDFDETFINGHLIGKKGRIREGINIGDLEDCYQEIRAYFIPPDYLNYGSKNVIAVRVYDGFIKGGIYEGPIGIVTRSRYLAWWSEVRATKSKSVFEMLFGN